MEEDFFDFIGEFGNGEFTIGGIKLPIEEVSQWFNGYGNQPIKSIPPAKDKKREYDVCPCIILTQGKNSKWTLILYAIGYYDSMGQDNLELLSRATSTEAFFHAFEDTSGDEAIFLYRNGAMVSTYRDSAGQEQLEDLRECVAEHAESIGEAGVLIDPSSEVIDDYASIYRQLEVHPVAAAVDSKKKLRIEKTSAKNLSSVVAYELDGFCWPRFVETKMHFRDQVERIDLSSFNMHQLLFNRYVQVDSIVLRKDKIDVDGREVIQTNYFHATQDGLQKLDKRKATALLTQNGIKRMRESKEHLPKTEVKRQHKNGNVDLLYKPSKYDEFTIKLTVDNVGDDVKSFLDSLATARTELRFGAVEPAKSGRSKCRTCSQKIEKGELRIGEYHEAAFDYPPTGWHHARCVAIPDATRLHGYKKLSVEAKLDLINLLET